MRTLNLSRVMIVVLGAGVGLVIAAPARSQDAQDSQNTSVAEAARRAREKKKNPDTASKSTKVITDDNLERGPFPPGQEGLNVGAPPKLDTEPPSAQAVAAAEAGDLAADEAAQKEAERQDSEIASLKAQIPLAEKDLDLAKRQLALDQDTYFANTDYAHDLAGKAALEAEKQQISDKQEAVEKLKARLATLEERKGHRKAARSSAPPVQTGNTPAENPPSAPPQN